MHGIDIQPNVTRAITMAKKKQAASPRRVGRRVEVYNEGLCVYLHDEGNADRLRKLIETKAEPDEDFYSNLSTPAFANAVAAESLAIAYELQQDAEVDAEVIVGPVMTAEELSHARWLPVQRGKLSLPTGRLRIDTPNTMPLDPEEPGDSGAVIDVPPGNYAVSLYRVDWQECERESIKYKGPGEIIVLTPLEDAEPISDASPILVYPEPVEDLSWLGAHTLNGDSFDCQVNFWDYWEYIRINLNAEAVANLGVKCGSVLRLNAAGMTFDLIFLDDMSRESYLSRYGRAAFEAQLGEQPEVAMGGWQEWGGHRILSFYRHMASKAVPVKYHERWIPASGQVLSESYAPPAQSTTLPAARREGDKVHAVVAHVNDELLIVNATRDLLEELGATLKLTLPTGVYSVAVVEHDRHSFVVFLTGKVEPKGLHFLKAMGLRSFARAGKKVLKSIEALGPERIPATECQPMASFFPPTSGDPLSACLHLRPMNVDGNAAGFDWPAPPAVGTTATLEKALD
jgi:hypothetical protein